MYAGGWPLQIVVLSSHEAESAVNSPGPVRFTVSGAEACAIRFPALGYPWPVVAAVAASKPTGVLPRPVGLSQTSTKPGAVQCEDSH